MDQHSSAIGMAGPVIPPGPTRPRSSSTPTASPGPRLSSGIGWGLVGVVAFSFTVPFTAIAVRHDGGTGLTPVQLAAGRAVIAALLAVAVLVACRVRPPTRRQIIRLLPVSFGVVAGFPLLTSMALPQVPAGHAAVVIGVLPAATAVVAVLLTGERPSPRFWVGATAGVLVTVVFTVLAHGSVTGGGLADLYLAGAVVAAAIGYAQGGRMSRELGSWQTICWALVLAAPVMAVVAGADVVAHPPQATTGQWAAFGYLAAVSMFLGFFAWYRGLAIGPITTVSQTQLVQPVLSVGWSVVLLGETPTPALVIGGLAVIACAAFTVRSRIS
ncbi:DMT family transporter [Gordonia sp. NB41Y]|uniref:DMT family transporter n=1 Tax=Gordonia sp. NB41Y TaxID=875808 RepID=UPI0021C7B6B8|nr:DMT family transporter [Gordonia sp. NB41Y]WLP92085.1 DMT family transporter [Gordonia sp. NB41Y]